jgi:hypothetical protein
VPRRKPSWRAPCHQYACRDATSVPNEEVSGAPAQGRRNSDQFSVRLSDLVYVCSGRDAKNLICIPHNPGVH